MNYKNLPKGTEIFEYDNLSDEAKAFARQEILNSDLKHLSKEIETFKNKVKENVHVGVNNISKLPYFIKRKKHIQKTRSNLRYIESYIIQNYCNFTKQGVYITYSI